MDFQIISIFPDLFPAFFGNGIIRRAAEKQLIRAHVLDLRSYTADRHRTTDDRPYGGGCGMVMIPGPVTDAIRDAKKRAPGSPVIYLSPQGKPFSQEMAAALSLMDGMILVCGRYEGLDERVIESEIDLELSVGDYVLTGGEIPAMTVMDAVTRLLPGALGGPESAVADSFSGSLLEHAHYTRPASFEGREVPGVLLSGNHGFIAQWRRRMSLLRTALKRPDLLRGRELTPEERRGLEDLKTELEELLAG
ncbi:MAG: tRNA (guanosine(37)-N1)-methyltransferase TrmD [Desulfobacterales bacterium]|nr:MAG: tRNA (guanosine(37)-N1)-methyltransferase TrmD [Desulfobacterales bacterium]